jgi:hypothetical protein
VVHGGDAEPGVGGIGRERGTASSPRRK